jgi:hypothetical protein
MVLSRGMTVKQGHAWCCRYAVSVSTQTYSMQIDEIFTIFATGASVR